MRVQSLLSPLAYAIALVAIYLAAYFPTPLAWHDYTFIDTRYAPVFALYLFALLLGAFAVYPLRLKYFPDPGDIAEAQSVARANLLLFVVAAFCIARLIALKQIPLFGDLAARYDTSRSLGGFIDYTATLANPLAIFFVYRFRKARSWPDLAKACTLLMLQLLYFRRQDIFIITVGSFAAYFYGQKLSLKANLQLIFLALPFAALLLGLTAALRAGGVDNVSRAVAAWELPFWIALSDLTGAIKFGHYVLDLFNSGGLAFNYTLGVFVAITGSDQAHSAALLQSYVPTAVTAQSINAPLSYLLDGDWPYVLALGLTHGICWSLLRYRVRDVGFVTLATIVIFLQALWTIRSGELLFPPARLYELAMLAMLFYVPSRDRSSFAVQQIARLSFIVALSASCAALLIRLPAAI
jgi:hypothetical protein